MPTLEEVEVAFSQWRASKINKRERTPENLMEMARALVGEHGVQTVSRRLKLSAHRLSPTSEVSGEFLEVPNNTGGNPWVITVNLRLSPKREITVTLRAGNVSVVSEFLKGISKL